MAKILKKKENEKKHGKYFTEGKICNQTLCKGRYDVSTQTVRDEFNDIPLQPILSELMKCCLKTRYVCNIGILVTNSNSENGPWHRYLLWYIIFSTFVYLI